MSRAWSLALPVMTVLVVAYALFVAGVPRPVAGARIYGGPTEGMHALSLRVESVLRDGEHETPDWDGPLVVSAYARVGARRVHVSPVLGGVAEIELEFEHGVHGPVSLEVRSAAGSLLAKGDIALGVPAWTARARRRGAWIRGRALDQLQISIAAERGAFVVGAWDPLLIRVERKGSSVPNAELTFRAEGARLGEADSARTDARGRARVRFQPFDLNPTVRVEARAEGGDTGHMDSGVPVVPGGLHVVMSAGKVRIESSTPRTEAYFSLVGEGRRVTGGALRLIEDGRGGSYAMADLPELPHPSWLVVSSEVDLNSAAAIGWPLDVADEPAPTFDVPDALLLDGLPAAFQREQDRRARVRWLTASFIALAFGLSVALLVVRVRAADRLIDQHLRGDLDRQTARRVAPRGVLPLLVGLLALGLGFIALALVVAARAR